MHKSVAVMLVLVFLAATSIITFKPVSAAYPDSWVSKAPMQVARSSLGVAVVNGKIYAIGGSVENGYVGTNEEYDPATDTWTFRTPMPTPRGAFAIASYQNKIYCIGGYSNDGNVTGANEVYDPATDKWESKAAMPTIRVALKANLANGKIYLIGGYTPERYTTYNFSSSSLNEVYDPTSDSWTTKSSLPFETSNYASAVGDNKIYIIGGLANSSITNPNQIYDAETDTWTQGAASPSTIAYAEAVATVGVNAPKRIHVLSYDFSTNNTCVLQVFDPKLDTWTYGGTLPTFRREYAVAVVNDLLYAIGGLTTVYREPFDWSSEVITLYTTNEQYTPFGFGTPDPSYDGTAPEIRVSSPENKTYNNSNITLSFSVNEMTSWTGYSLDGLDNVTSVGNTTLTGLPVGEHNITVYAVDAAGNVGASETICFTMPDAPEPLPVATVAAASAASVAIAGVGLLVYFRKRKRQALAAS